MPQRSIYSVIVYLNGPPDFAGGKTVVYSADRFRPEVIEKVLPATGNALIFTHDMLHEGKKVEPFRDSSEEPVKYILRTDIMFK